MLKFWFLFVTALYSKWKSFRKGQHCWHCNSAIMDISATESNSPAADLSMEWSSYFPHGYYGSGSKKEDVRKIKAAKKVAQRNDDAMPKTANQNGAKGKKDNKFTVALICLGCFSMA